MRKPVLSGILAGVFLLAVADAVGTRIGLLDGSLLRTDGPWMWTSSRAAGVAGYLALSFDVIFGLFISTGRADRWIPRAQTVTIHQWLSGATLALIAAHGFFLLGDGFIRFDVLDTMVPLLDTYRPPAVALGIVAAYAACLVHWSFSLRGRIGASAWRKIHYLTFLLFVLATAHGALAGTDSSLPWMTALYVTVTGLVTALVATRVLRAWGTTSRRLTDASAARRQPLVTRSMTSSHSESFHHVSSMPSQVTPQAGHMTHPPPRIRAGFSEGG
jgi:predicted ferric reductase